ncbi:Protein translocase subunit SecY [Geobacillus sp. BCO2]|nr:Protein translocase subunit SecY [Geobacillus sp. BCO2]
MFRTISNFMRVSDIRNKIIFTLLMLIVFRIGTFIPVPGVNADVLKLQDELNAFGVLNIFRRRGAAKLFDFCHGGYALYHGIDYRPAAANGRCSQIYGVVEARRGWAA